MMTVSGFSLKQQFKRRASTDAVPLSMYAYTCECVGYFIVINGCN